MDPKQCKMARAGLGWRTVDLADKSGIHRVTIARFEGDKPVDANTIKALKEALEKGGAVFNRRLAGRVGVTVPE